MRLALGLGVFVGTAAVIAAVVASAAVGDAIYLKRDSAGYALDTSAKRAAIGSLLTGSFTGLTLADVRSARCYQWDPAGPGLASVLGAWKCAVRRHRSLTAADALDLVLAGRASDLTASDGVEWLGTAQVTDLALVDSAVSAVFASTRDRVAEFECLRGTPVACRKIDIVTAAPATWAADHRAGAVLGTVGRAE